jgi:hypothetical protein
MQQLDYNNGRDVISTWSVPRGSKRDEVWSLLQDSEFCTGGGEETTRAREGVKNRCQRTACEDTAGWKMLSGCCGDL